MEDKKHDLQNIDGWIPLLSGGKFNLLAPMPEMVFAEDLAAGLAYKGHFSGLTPKFFSIAEHCLLTAEIIQQSGGSMEERLVALLHDAEEAYTGDMVKPLKVHMPYFEEVATRIRNEAIFPRFGCDPALIKKIKWADLQAQEREYNFFYKRGEKLHCLAPDQARHAYKHHLEYLLHKLGRSESTHIGSL